MVEVVREEKIEMSVNTVGQADWEGTTMRCRDCGLEWEASYAGAACPLRELEMTFLSEDWFMGLGEEPSELG